MAPALSLIGLMLTSLASGNESLSDRQILERAQAALRDGMRLTAERGSARARFAEAASHYEALRARGFRSAALFCNQGDAYLLAGDVPGSILAYRRGLQLAPDDERLHSHLWQARKQVTHGAPIEIGRPPDVRVWLYLPPQLEMGLALLLYYGAGLALAGWWLTRRGWLLGATVLLGALSFVPFCRLALEHLRRLDEAEHPLVVISKDQTELRWGNGSAYPARYPKALRRGVEGRCLYQRKGWLQIELADGYLGWIPREAALIDAPQSTPLQWH
jgi:hypothetical protein